MSDLGRTLFTNRNRNPDRDMGRFASRAPDTEGKDGRVRFSQQSPFVHGFQPDTVLRNGGSPACLQEFLNLGHSKSKWTICRLLSVICRKDFPRSSPRTMLETRFSYYFFDGMWDRKWDIGLLLTRDHFLFPGLVILYVQGSAKRLRPGLMNFVSAVASTSALTCLLHSRNMAVTF